VVGVGRRRPIVSILVFSWDDIDDELLPQLEFVPLEVHDALNNN
jgi:hypothetical protein